MAVRVRLADAQDCNLDLLTVEPGATVLVNGTGDRYYWDAATSILHAKLFIRSGRTSTTLQVIG